MQKDEINPLDISSNESLDVHERASHDCVLTHMSHLGGIAVQSSLRCEFMNIRRNALFKT